MALIDWGLGSQPYRTLNWLCVQRKSVHARSDCLWVYFYIVNINVVHHKVDL